MKKNLALLFLAVLTALTVRAQRVPTLAEVGLQAMPDTIAPVKAPFAMPQPERPDFGTRRTLLKLKSGRKATRAIQQAIDRLSARGGGTVVVPPGQWSTGRLELKSGVCLHLSKGCELVFSGDIADYQPAVFTRDEGMELFSTGACIYACDAHDIGVTGQGVISGPSTKCEIYRHNARYTPNPEPMIDRTPLEQRHYNGLDTTPVFLPKTIAPIRCTRVLVEGVTLRATLYWNIVPQYCRQVIIRGVTVESHGHGRTDGIDVDSSSDVLIEYCSMDCGDDTYTLKSGRGNDGIRVNRPTENVVIRHCLALRGQGGLVVGTETAGGVSHVYMHDCVFKGTNQAFRFKTRRPRGGGMTDVVAERIRADVVKQAFFVDMLGSSRYVGDLARRLPLRAVNALTPDFHTIRLSDILVERCGRLFDMRGLPERPLRNVVVNRLTAHCREFMSMNDVSSLTLADSHVDAADTGATLTGCSGLSLVNCTFTQPVTWQLDGSTPPLEVPIQLK